MKLQPLAIHAPVFATLMLLAGASQAGFTVFASESNFLAVVNSPGVDTFSGLSVTSITPSPLSRAAGPYAYSASVALSSFYGAGTAANPSLSTNAPTDAILFSGFGGGVSAIGGNFFVSNVDGAFVSGSMTLTATDSFGATSTQTIVDAATSSFLGFVSTGTLTSLVASAVQPGGSSVWPTVDNLRLAQASAQPIPEPQIYAMILVGLGVLRFTSRSRSPSTRTT